MDKEDQLNDIAEAALTLHYLLIKSGTPLMQKISMMLLLEIGTALASSGAVDPSDATANEVSARTQRLRLLD